MSLRSQFTDSEWQNLQKAPIWAFLITASADGKVDTKEITAFSKELAESGLYRDELAREVFSSLVTDLPKVLNSCMLAPQEMLDCLRDVGHVLDAKATAHASGFKGAVLLICKNVAEASGGGLLKKSKISKEEIERIALVAATLGLS